MMVLDGKIENCEIRLLPTYWSKAGRCAKFLRDGKLFYETDLLDKEDSTDEEFGKLAREYFEQHFRNLSESIKDVKVIT